MVTYAEHTTWLGAGYFQSFSLKSFGPLCYHKFFLFIYILHKPLNVCVALSQELIHSAAGTENV